MNKFFISRPIFAISLALVVVFLGVISLFNLSIEQYPDITPPVVEVTATYDGADATTVNNTVATPLAQSIMGVSDMLYMEAVSASDGTMTLQVTFEIGSDPDMDAVFTQNNVATATALLPESVVRQGVTTRKTQTGFLMVYALHSDGRYDGQTVSNYAYINLQNRLLKIDGVGKVAIMGAAEYALRVWLKPDVLDYYNIAVDDIVSAIATQSGTYPAGKFGAEPSEEGTQFTYTVTLPAGYSTAEQFADIIVRTTESGEQIRLSELATVSLGSQSYGTVSSFDSQPTAVVVVYQEPGSNAVAVGSRVRAEMEHAAQSFPDGITYSTIVDSTESIMAGIEEIIFTLILSLVLVILIIYIFIQDWRATVIPLVAIPVSIVGTFTLFPLLGYSINIVSLLALILAIGLVVDDAIVVVEAVQVNIERGMTPFEATLEAMKSVTSPIVATSVVLLAVFIPVSFSGGISGALFQQFAVTISVAVVLSTINALTLSPALCAKILKPKQKPTVGFFAAFNRTFDRAMTKYLSLTERAVQRTKRTLASLCTVVVLIICLWRVLPTGFLPGEDQGYIMVFTQTPTNSSLQVTQRALESVDSIIRELPEVESTAVVAGFNMLSGVSQSWSGVTFVKLTPFGKRKLSAMQIAAQLTESLNLKVATAESYAFVQPAIPGLGVTSGVTFALQDTQGRGSDYLAEHLGVLLDSLNSSPLIASATTQFDNAVSQRFLEVDREQAMMKGVELDRLYNELSTLLGGKYISNFNRFGRLYRSYIQAAPEYRADPSALSSYFVASTSGESVPLSSLVAVRDTVGVETVKQFNLFTSADVTVTAWSGVSSGEAMDAIEQVAASTLPDDLQIAWSGVSLLESREGGGDWRVYAVAVIFVFLVLAALYESWELPLAIMLAVPLAVMGSLLFVWIAHSLDNEFVNDIYTQISLVMLIGLSAKNAILVVEYADNLYSGGKTLLEATTEAAALRARPIIMTAFAFILGVLPLVFASGAYSTARNIMGVALVGGMLTATLVGLVLYPALYYLIRKTIAR